MPVPWFRRVRQAGELSVFDKAGSWSKATAKAVATFNGLNFPVKLVKTTDEKNANIVVKLANGADSQSSWGNTASTDSDFDPTRLHGLTVSIIETHERRKTTEVIFAAIFLPAKVQATEEQKEVIIVHEFIHASGLNGDGTKEGRKRDQDHENTGIMYDIMMPDGKGLVEGSKPSDVGAMPPIRVGPQTRSKMQLIWGTEASKKD